MGKKNKKKRQLSEGSIDEAPAVVSSKRPSQPTGQRQHSNGSSSKTKKKKKASVKNPLLEVQSAFLDSLSETERNLFFSNTELDPERRAALWMQQADVGEEAVSRYAWATPDDRALTILKHFSPLIEIGCGANAYWCQQMVQAGIDVIGYDLDPDHGGQMGDTSNRGEEGTKHAAGESSSRNFVVRKGGPEVLAHKKNSRRTLFLCYADEEDNDSADDQQAQEDEGLSSMGLSALEHYKGDYVIHVGELFRDASLSMEQAPWGRSSSPEFQVELATSFHCILHVALLSNWLHTRDSLSVWKRSEKCTLVFAADDDDDEAEENEEVEYRHVPVNERLPTDVAAPCLQHLLAMPHTPVVSTSPPNTSSTEEKLTGSQPNGAPPASSTAGGSTSAKKKRKKKSKSTGKNSPEQEQPSSANKTTDYECPW